MKRILIVMMCLVLFGSVLGAGSPVSSSAQTYQYTVTATAEAENVPTTGYNLVVYTAGSSARTLQSSEYKFRTSRLMVFRADGSLAEVGANLIEEKGCVQEAVTIPAGGFMIAMGSNAPLELNRPFIRATMGITYYNNTFTAAYDGMNAQYEKASKKITISYDDPPATPSDAIKFLFVGNSTTYVHATPIKFREMCKAAGVNVEVTYCTEGSAYLEYFAEGGKHSAKFDSLIAKQKYDYVVLQEAAGGDYTNSSAALKKLMPKIIENGATPVFYMRYYSDKSSCYELTDKYFTLYSRLAKDYNTIYAPVVVAFLRAQENYPSINLYADDYSHHGKAGSYLIAATWMYAFLGINPVGNTYTADMDADTVLALQKCAASAIENPYSPNGPFSDFTDNGVTYTNLALNKTYERTGTPYTQNEGKWIDYDPNTKQLIGKMTDGFVAENGDHLSIGAYKGSAGVPTDIIIDLEKVCELKKFETDLHGNTWGITSPAKSSITILVSEDGQNFTDLGEMIVSKSKTSGAWVNNMYELLLEDTVKARYVKFSYLVKEGPNYIAWMSETAVFGRAEEEQLLRGDINADNIVNAKDYLIVKRTVLGNYTPTPEEKARMDVSGDNNINAKDYTIVKRIALGTL